MLSGWNFTSGWGLDGANISVLNSNTFVATAGGNGIYKISIGVVGSRYKIQMSGTTTGTIVIGSGANTSMIKGPTSGAFDFSTEFTWLGNASFFIQGGTAGTTTINKIILIPLTGLIAAYNMQKVGNTLVDISGGGKNVTINAAAPYVATKDGLQCYNKSTGTVNNDLVVTTDVVTDWTYSCAANNLDFIDNSVLFRLAGGIYFYSNNGFLQFYSGSALPFNPVITNAPKGLSVYSITYLNSTKTVTVYRNGVSIGTLVLGTALGSNSFTKILNASDWSGKQLVVGSMLDIRIHNRILTLQEIKDYNNSFVQPTLAEDFSDAGADNQASVPREWTTTSGSFKVVENVIKQGELVTNGDFSSATGWSMDAGWSISGGKMVGINNSTTQFSQALITFKQGSRYRIIFDLTVNVGGIQVYLGTSLQIVASSITTSGNQVIEFTSRSNASGFNVYGLSNFNVTIDNVSITEIPPLQTITNGTKYLEAITNASLVATPNNQAYGSWEFDFYKATTVGSGFNFITNNTSWYPSFTGYQMYLNTGLSIELWRENNVVISQIATTANSYFSLNTWYRIRITRTTSGAFTLLIKGGAFTPTAGYDGWTLVSMVGGVGTNPTTDNTFTSSNYFLMYLNAGDRIANLTLKNGIKI